MNISEGMKGLCETFMTGDTFDHKTGDTLLRGGVLIYLNYVTLPRYTATLYEKILALDILVVDQFISQ